VTAVLAAAARATLVAVIVLAVLAGSLYAAYGPQGLWVMAWLAAMLAVILGAGLGLHALRPRDREPAPEPLTERQLEAARRLAAEALADSHLAIERYAGQAVPRHLEGEGHADPA
jgi:hypothetical protein